MARVRERIGAGALAALGAIPVGVLLTVPPVPFERIYLGAVCFALPFIARFLYTRASGGYLVHGKPAFALVCVPALFAATLTSTVVGLLVYFELYGEPVSVAMVVSAMATPDFFFSLLAALIGGGGGIMLAVISARKPPIQPISATRPNPAGGVVLNGVPMDPEGK